MHTFYTRTPRSALTWAVMNALPNRVTVLEHPSADVPVLTKDRQRFVGPTAILAYLDAIAVSEDE